MRILTTLLVLLLIATTASAQALRVRTIASGYNGSGGVAVLPNGDILVADFGSAAANGRTVLRFTPDGEQSTYADGLFGASGNVLDANGNLIQSNIGQSEVVSISPDGNISSLSGGISTPIGVAIRSDGSIYVAACGSNQIMRVNPGSAASVYSNSSLLVCPNGLTVDDQDNLYTVNFSGRSMVKIDTAGNASLFAQIPGNGNGHVTFGNDRFYVTANRTNQIFQVDRQGQVTLLAGTGGFGANDGPPDEARFNRPNGIAISPDGRTLYVSQKTGGLPGGGLNPNALRAIDLDVGEPQVAINVGVRGSWFDSLTPGQGILIDLVDGQPTMFAAWYTFIADGEEVGPSGNGQRWYSLQGSYADNRAELLIYENTGGVFGQQNSVSTVAVGTFVLEFVSCTSAIATYEFSSVARSGTLALTRLSPDVLCAALTQ